SGGSILKAECISIKEPEGKNKSGNKFTGNLKKVIEESIDIALSYVQSVLEKLGIDPTFFQKNTIKIHLLEGAIPKDGPSAGVLFVVILVSRALSKPVKEYVAMTGEISLTGKVLPIGGLKEKLMAVERETLLIEQIKKEKVRYEVFVPIGNKEDIKKIDPKVLDVMDIIYVSDVLEVLNRVFEEQNLFKE
ncbi:MAG: S16 family serine protease, partial [Bacteroidota bacterium]